MPGEVSVPQLDGYFKKNYADKLQDLVPDLNKLTKATSFSQRYKLGQDYNQPVVVSMEQGVTYAGPGSGAFGLEVPAALAVKNASIKGYQMLIRGQMDYEVAALASSDETSFGRATATQVRNMLASITKRLEISMFYGRRGIGDVASGAGNFTNVNATETNVLLTNPSFAPYIWAGLKNAVIVARSNNAIVGTGADQRFTVKQVDFQNRRLFVTGTAAGITALQNAITANGAQFFFATSYTGTDFNEFLGLQAIMEESTNLFGIDVQQFDLFRGNVYDNLNRKLTFGRVNEALEMAVSIGGLDEDITAYVSTETWMGMNTDLAALSVKDYSYKSTMLENGSQAICYNSINGKIQIEAHPGIKRGDAFLLPVKRIKRVGATDPTFSNPGKGGEIFRELDAQAGFEVRCYLNQAPFIDEPRKFVYVKNIDASGT